MLNIVVDVIIRTVILIFRVGRTDDVVDKVQRPVQFCPVFLIILCRISEVAYADEVTAFGIAFYLNRSQRRQMPGFAQRMVGDINFITADIVDIRVEFTEVDKHAFSFSTVRLAALEAKKSCAI